MSAQIGARDKGCSCAWDGVVRGFDPDLFRDVARRVEALYAFGYGYALNRPRHQSPWYCTFGNVSLDNSSPEERRAAFRWHMHWAAAREAGVSPLAGGVYRGISPVNLLTDEHPARPLCDTPVPERIAAEDGRGLLHRLMDRLWVWDVPPRGVPRIREEFIEGGLLVGYPSPPAS